MFSPRDSRKIRKAFRTLAEARAWRQDAGGAIRRGIMRAPSTTTLRQAANAWLDGAENGTIRNRSGDVFKPSVLRGYRAALEHRILPDYGARRIGDVSRLDLQDLADRLLADGLDPSTVRNVLMPLRVIYRRALARGDVAVNPTVGLDLPPVRGTRDRIATPTEAARLIAALDVDDQALWATATYAGLRRGELRALRWQDLDLNAGVIRVERSMDETGEIIETKSKAGRRTVPIVKVLREHLIAHRLRAGRLEGLVFCGRETGPFSPSAVRRRALSRWQTLNEAEIERAEVEKRKPDLLDPIGLHEARHTYASLMIAAGVNVKALSTYMGHSSITITLDRYGHLMPGNEEEAASLLDAYLDRAMASVPLQ